VQELNEIILDSFVFALFFETHMPWKGILPQNSLCDNATQDRKRLVPKYQNSSARRKAMHEKRRELKKSIEDGKPSFE
jgi:hypothetical protein